MHHTTASNTRKSAEKEKREWNDLLSEKKAYLRRKQQEEDAERERRFWEGDEDNSIDEIR